MEARGFRIGNYVHHNDANIITNFINDYLTVCEIDESNINTYYINIDFHKQIVRGKVGYKPIPLTDDWLLKFKFKAVDGRWESPNDGLFAVMYLEGDEYAHIWDTSRSAAMRRQGLNAPYLSFRTKINKV